MHCNLLVNYSELAFFNFRVIIHLFVDVITILFGGLGFDSRSQIILPA